MFPGSFLNPADRMLQCPDLQSSPTSCIHLRALFWVLSSQDPTASARTWRTGIALSLGTSRVWGYEVTRAVSATTQCKSRSMAMMVPAQPSPAWGPLLSPGCSLGLALPVSAWGRGHSKKCSLRCWKSIGKSPRSLRE